MERRGERPRELIQMLDGRACARTRYQHFEVLNMNIYVQDHLSFAENRATTVCALWTLGAGQARSDRKRARRWSGQEFQLALVSDVTRARRTTIPGCTATCTGRHIRQVPTGPLRECGDPSARTEEKSQRPHITRSFERPSPLPSPHGHHADGSWHSRDRRAPGTHPEH